MKEKVIKAVKLVLLMAYKCQVILTNALSLAANKLLVAGDYCFP